MPDALCPNCGNEIQPGEEICPSCDLKLQKPETGIKLLNDDGNTTSTDANQQSEGEELIPIEPYIEQFTTPRPLTDKVEVSPEQRSNIRLLKSILNPDPTAEFPAKQRSIPTAKIAGIVIFLLLLLGALIPLIYNRPIFPPGTADSEVSRVSQYIHTLPQNAPVLVAFDFQPGFSSELDISSNIVMEQLMARESYLALISTSPTGVALAERAISSVAAENGFIYEPYNDYGNLGYIPGGSVGLHFLTNDIRSTFPLSVDGYEIWDSPGLQSVDAVTDFSLVIVITESPETARSWIEQVATKLEATPFMMVVSSQVDPVIRPYSEAVSNNVDAVISGIHGGEIYRNYLGRQVETDKLWSGFSFSILIAAAVILAGSFIAAVLGASSPESSDEGDSR